jgi:tRNA(His) guanylyltransferase
MRAHEFEAAQRAREWFHSLTVPPGAWTIVRVDGRSFSRFTDEHYAKPFDPQFSQIMTATAEALLIELQGRYAYTESDEISVLLPRSTGLFGRSLEKLVSISAGVASATFTHTAGVTAHFDSRVWVGTDPGDVVDYFSWRQADAARCALNGWCYWTLRKAGLSMTDATARLHGTSTSAKNEMLFEHGINFAAVPAWQRRGIGIWHEATERTGFDPVRGVAVTTTRRSVRTERELPMKDAYRDLVAGFVTAP